MHWPELQVPPLRTLRSAPGELRGADVSFSDATSVPAIDRNDRIRVTVPKSVHRLEVLDLLHVGLVGHVRQLGHPVVNRLAVLLLDRREV